jgi:hypothetical protein
LLLFDAPDVGVSFGNALVVREENGRRATDGTTFGRTPARLRGATSSAATSSRSPRPSCGGNASRKLATDRRALGIPMHEVPAIAAVLPFATRAE